MYMPLVMELTVIDDFPPTHNQSQQSLLQKFLSTDYG
jgi:hypothetical protein